MEGVPDFALYLPGVDSHLNANRRQGVPFAVQHRTQGNDSRGLGANRHHSTPGTFQFLNHETHGLICYYPAWVRCTHAAGGNDGVGVENEGWNGEPLGPRQVENLGLLIRWLHDTYGVPMELYDGPRVQIDDSGFRGHVNHNSIQTAPQWRHVDRIEPAEFRTAVGGPKPKLEEGDDLVFIVNSPGPPGAVPATWALTPTERRWVKTDGQMRNCIALGQSVPANRGPMTAYGFAVGNVPSMPWNDISTYTLVGDKPAGW